MKPLAPANVESAVRKRLLEGANATILAGELKLRRKVVFNIARKYSLPTNPRCLQGGMMEAQIFQSSTVLTVPECARFYNTSEARIRGIVDRVKERMRKWHSNFKPGQDWCHRPK